MRVQQAHQQAADAENQRRQHHGAHQVSGQRLQFRLGQWRQDEARDERRQQKNERAQHTRRQRGQRHGSAGQAPGGRLVLRAQARVDRDEGGAQRAARHHHKDQLRQLLRAEKGVQRRACPEGRGDDGRAQHAQQAADDEAQQHHQGGAHDLSIAERAYGRGLCHGRTSCPVARGGRLQGAAGHPTIASLVNDRSSGGAGCPKSASR